MIVGLGTDIIEIVRIGQMIERHGEIFLQRVYTDGEIRYCQRRKECYQHFAGRFAVKEAVFKALGTGWTQGVSWRQVETTNDESGRPAVLLRGNARQIADRMAVKTIHVSISHSQSHAIAQVILEK